MSFGDCGFKLASDFGDFSHQGLKFVYLPLTLCAYKYLANRVQWNWWYVTSEVGSLKAMQHLGNMGNMDWSLINRDFVNARQYLFKISCCFHSFSVINIYWIVVETTSTYWIHKWHLLDKTGTKWTNRKAVSSGYPQSSVGREVRKETSKLQAKVINSGERDVEWG